MAATRRAAIEENELNAGLVFDMVYNPLETPLINWRRRAGFGVSAWRCLCSKARASSRSGPASPLPKPKCCAWSSWSCAAGMKRLIPDVKTKGDRALSLLPVGDSMLEKVEKWLIEQASL